MTTMRVTKEQVSEKYFDAIDIDRAMMEDEARKYRETLVRGNKTVVSEIIDENLTLTITYTIN